jgi:hypothetical protein
MVVQLAPREFIKTALDTGATPGSAIPPMGPMLPSGRTPGTATPAETKNSAGWSHFLFFLQQALKVKILQDIAALIKISWPKTTGKIRILIPLNGMEIVFSSKNLTNPTW